jgi:ATP-dependent DNA ligase
MCQVSDLIDRDLDRQHHFSARRASFVHHWNNYYQLTTLEQKLFELKYDGFRALAYLDRGSCRLVSRNGHPFASFSALVSSITRSLESTSAIFDGEIVCVDRKGRPQFNDLLFRRGEPRFFAFDLLYLDGKDLRL